MSGCAEFTTKDGKIKFGYLVRFYYAFEGDMRFIFRCEDDGRDYRCVKDTDGNYVEYVA